MHMQGLTNGNPSRVHTPLGADIEPHLPREMVETSPGVKEIANDADLDVNAFVLCSFGPPLSLPLMTVWRVYRYIRIGMSRF